MLDAVLEQDSTGRVACETLVTTGLCMIAGEITTKGWIDYPKVARETIRDVGYTQADFGFDCHTCAVVSTVDEQSPDIAMGVDPGGAGDQGLMFGYASNETKELMPLPISLAHKLVAKLTEVRKTDELDYLRPDGKSQVTVEYEGGKPTRIDAVVISTQHGERVEQAQIRREILDHVIRPVITGMDGRRRHEIPHQPDRPLRCRRSARRHRIDRPQDHRRYLRRHGATRRRGVFG